MSKRRATSISRRISRSSHSSLPLRLSVIARARIGSTGCFAHQLACKADADWAVAFYKRSCPSFVVTTRGSNTQLRERKENTPAPAPPVQPENGPDSEVQASTGQIAEDSDSETSWERSSASSEELSKCVKKLLPSRPLLPQRQRQPERALQEYHSQIARLTSQMLEQFQLIFRATFIPGSNPLDPATCELCKTHFLEELNRSGTFFTFKEQMKDSVVQIVREKCLRTELLNNPDELRAPLTQLYVFLVDEMHVAVNKTLSEEVQEVPVKILLDCSQLTHFAKEAQLIGDYQLASQYYQEQLTRDQQSPSPWFDYGMFCMQTEEYFKAEECFRQALSIDQTHICSLLMCGILSEMDKRYEEAEKFLKSATRVDPICVVSWTLLGLFFFAWDNEKQAEMVFQKAWRQQRNGLVSDTVNMADSSQTSQKALGEEETGASKSLSDPVKSEQGSVRWGTRMLRRILHFQQTKVKETTTTPSTTIYLETAMFLVQMHAIQMAQRALAHELLSPKRGPRSLYHLALGHLELLRGEYSSAKENLQEVLNKDDQIPDAWALYGHLHYLLKDYEKAKSCYERTLKFDTECSDTHPVYIRLGSIYLQNGQYDKAKKTYLRACMSSPSCLTWLGLGIACLRLGELTMSEDALTDANALNNKNPEVWGYISLLCLQTGRKVEAEQSYKYALKFNLKDDKLLQELGELHSKFTF